MKPPDVLSLWRKLEARKQWQEKDQKQVLSPKAMKSSPLLGQFGDSEFWGFSLLKIKIGWRHDVSNFRQ